MSKRSSLLVLAIWPRLKVVIDGNAKEYGEMAVVYLMQKYIDMQLLGTNLQIRSVVSLDHLKGFLYIEADREAHVREACKGLQNIYSQIS